MVVKDEVGVEEGMEVDFTTADKESIGGHIKDWQAEVNSLEHLMHHLYEHAIGTYTSESSIKGESTWKEYALDLEFHLLSAPEKVFKAHSFIVSCRSFELETQIQQHLDDSGNARPIKITVPADISADVFPEFLRFLYTFKCEITPSNVSSMLQNADHYQVRSLRKACGEFLYAQVQVKEENVFEILTNAMEFHLDDIKERCMDIIQKNTSVFTDKTIYSKMKPAHLEEIVKFNILPLNEEKLFEFIVKWSAYMKEPVIVVSEAVVVPELNGSADEAEASKVEPEKVESVKAEEGKGTADADSVTAVAPTENGEAPTEAPTPAAPVVESKPVVAKRESMKGEELKALLANVLANVRFPVMSAEFFVDTVVPLKILSMEDEWSIFQDIASRKLPTSISRFSNDPREQVKAAFKVSIEAGKSKTSTLHTKRLKWSFSFFTKPHRFYREYNYEYCRVCRQNPRHECYYYNMEVTVDNIAPNRKDSEPWQCELESLEVRLLYPTHRAASAKGIAADVKPEAADATPQKSKTIYGPVSWKFDENKALFKVQELVDCHYYHPEHTDGVFLDRGFLYMEVIFKAKDKTTL